MGHIVPKWMNQGPKLTHQEADLLYAEGVGAAEVVSQAPRCGNDHVWFPGELQGLGHHVCGWNSRDGARQMV